MKYLSLFSGIGTAEKGIEQAYERANHQYESEKPQASNGESGRFGNTDIDGNGIRIADESAFRRNAECVGYAEIDRFAASVYKYHWPNVRNYGDATGIVCDELPDFDFLVAGFPCQSFSIAGKRQGFNEARGTLFFEIARILSHKRPRHFLLENVKGLLSSDDGKVYTTILRILSDLNYRVETVVLNSKHYGVPQNRERVFFIGHLGTERCGEILSFGDGDGEFDEVQRETGSEWERLSVDTESSARTDGGIEGRRQDEGRYGDNGIEIIAKDGTPKNKDIAATLCGGGHSGGNHSDMDLIVLNNPTHSNNRVYAEGGTSPALNTAQGGNRQPFVAIPQGVNRPSRGMEIRTDGNAAALKSGQSGTQRPTVAIPVLTPDRPTKRQNGRRFKEDGESAFTLTSQDRHGVMIATASMDVANAVTPDAYLTRGARNRDENGKAVLTSMADRRIRRLTPVECCRLQGLPDNWCDYGLFDERPTRKDLLAREKNPELWAYQTKQAGDDVTVREISDSQKYKTLGNAMTVNVVQAIIERMIEKGCLNLPG